MVLSSFSFAFDGAFAKVLSQNLDSVEVVFFRNGVTMIFVALSIVKLPIRQVGGKPWLLLFRALIGFASMLVFFYNIAHIPLADAITFSRTAPIFTAILAFFFLKEKIGWKGWVAVFIGFIGIVCVMKPNGLMLSKTDLFGLFSGLGAALGLGGLAFALAAKDTVANLFGSLVIFTDRPFKVGDWVETPAVEGMIEEIGIRSTKIRTFAQALVSMPNATLANAPITNWSRMGKRRVKTRLGLTYNTTVEQMQAILEEIKTMLKKHPDVHQETILVSFDEFDNSALSIFLYFFTKTTVWLEYLHVREDVNFKIMQIVARNGAQFAFPSQTLYVESLPK